MSCSWVCFTMCRWRLCTDTFDMTPGCIHFICNLSAGRFGAGLLCGYGQRWHRLLHSRNRSHTGCLSPPIVLLPLAAQSVVLLPIASQPLCSLHAFQSCVFPLAFNPCALCTCLTLLVHLPLASQSFIALSPLHALKWLCNSSAVAR